MSLRQHAFLFTVLIGVFSSTFSAGGEGIVTYEEFGAVGDGRHDDLPAICEAHAYANAHGLPVRTKPDATYHLGSKALTAIIATATDWSTSRFTIDDTQVENHQKSLFEVRSLLKPETLEIDRLARDQKQLDVRPERDCHVTVRNNEIKRYIRRGLNRNSGTSQRDCFILRRDGSIEGDVDWTTTTSVVLKPALLMKSRLSCGAAFSRPLRIKCSRRWATTTGPGTSPSRVPTRKLTA
jgi:hypothetical protein